MFGLPTTHSTGMPVLDARDDFVRARRAQLAARWLRRRRRPAHPPTLQGPDGYYVVDGRHRVSVALATGRREIDAWVA